MITTLVGTPDYDPDPAPRGLPTELLDLGNELDGLRAKLGTLTDELLDAAAEESS